MQNFKSFSFEINGLSVKPQYTLENIRDIFKPLLCRLSRMQREKGARLIVFLAAPPATGKSTLAAFLAHLSRECGYTPVQALGLDGFHYHQDYILSHSVTLGDGRTLPMQKVKGSPETYNVAHFAEKLKQLRTGNPLWPVYDRRLHDVVEDQVQAVCPIILIEGNWLLFQEGDWAKLAFAADYTIFIRAEEHLLRDRLIGRKMQGGLSKLEAESFYETGDGVNVRRTLAGSTGADLTLKMNAACDFTQL